MCLFIEGDGGREDMISNEKKKGDYLVVLVHRLDMLSSSSSAPLRHPIALALSPTSMQSFYSLKLQEGKGHVYRVIYCEKLQYLKLAQFPWQSSPNVPDSFILQDSTSLSLFRYCLL